MSYSCTCSLFLNYRTDWSDTIWYKANKQMKTHTQTTFCSMGVQSGWPASKRWRRPTKTWLGMKVHWVDSWKYPSFKSLKLHEIATLKPVEVQFCNDCMLMESRVLDTTKMVKNQKMFSYRSHAAAVRRSSKRVIALDTIKHECSLLWQNLPVLHVLL